MKSKNKPDLERSKQIFDLYKSGQTLSEIGITFGFTRSRAQQIVIKEIKKDILKRLGVENLTQDEKILLEMAAKEEILEISTQRKVSEKAIKKQETHNRISEKMKLIPDYLSFTTVSEYTRALNEETGLFKKYFPQISDSIVQKTKSRWSRYYLKCLACETMSIRHQAHGYCENCYPKTTIYKKIQNESRVRYLDERKKYQSTYSKEYSKRPEIVIKQKKIRDQKNYSGNREKALQRDLFICQNCKLRRSDSYEFYERDLYVHHINGKADNSLENLITLCKNCHNEKVLNKSKSNLNLFNDDIPSTDSIN